MVTFKCEILSILHPLKTVFYYLMSMANSHSHVFEFSLKTVLPMLLNGRKISLLYFFIKEKATWKYSFTQKYQLLVLMRK